MRTHFFTCLLLFASSLANAQEPALQKGQRFPDLVIRPIINAPVKQYDVSTNKKILLLNFWGTWCVPCIPEMDNLNKLQQKNKDKIQVIGISNEETNRLEKYLKQRPTTVWLASDTSMYLYEQFAFNYVGQCAVIGPDKKIIAVVKTDSINQSFIDRLLKNEPVSSNAEVGNIRTASVLDMFSVDSTTNFHVSLESFRSKMTPMGKTYPKTVFEGRRRSYINVSEAILYRDAYDIHAPSQVIFEPDEKSLKRPSWCFDLIVAPSQKDSFQYIMQETLNKLLTTKARVEKRKLMVYVLKQKTGSTMPWKNSEAAESTYSFTGKGFEGTAVVMKTFADYLENELGLSVVDETGLTGKYDIKTENVLRSKEDILKAVDALGLTVEKAEREMNVLILYR